MQQCRCNLQRIKATNGRLCKDDEIRLHSSLRFVEKGAVPMAFGLLFIFSKCNQIRAAATMSRFREADEALHRSAREAESCNM